MDARRRRLHGDNQLVFAGAQKIVVDALGVAHIAVADALAEGVAEAAAVR